MRGTTGAIHIDAYEKPLLYNPLNPAAPETDHFRVRLNSGFIEGLTDIGKATVQTLGLNTRLDLLEARRQAIKDTRRLIKEHNDNISFDSPELSDTDSEIKKIEDGVRELSFPRRAVWTAARRSLAAYFARGA